MEILCPACNIKMELATDPQGAGRRRFLCPRCEGEYVEPPPHGAAGTVRGAPAPAADPSSSSPPTVPGFTAAGVPGAEWQVPEELQFSLRVLEGTEAGKVFPVTRSRITVGREEGDILLGDPLVSRKHAAFEVFGCHHIVVKDLASTNGTYLNGRLIAYSKLNNGDQIKVGSTLMEAVIEIAG
jgi:type III secretion system (T3SS) inner membrane Yop/YscD-like protein